MQAVNPPKRAPKGEAVYVAVTLDKPLGPFSDKEPGGCFMQVMGIHWQAYAKEFPGRSLAWERIKFEHRHKLEMEPHNLSVTVDEFRKMVR